MPVSVCDHCDNPFRWGWEDAFCRWGFNYGAGSVQTYTVQHVLIENGYEVALYQAGECNIVITSIKKQGVEQLQNPEGKSAGFLRPRQCLSAEVIALLDTTFLEKAPWDLC